VKTASQPAKIVSVITLAALLLSLLAPISAGAQEPVYTLTLTGENPQSAATGVAFASPLQVTVTDGAGMPAPNVAVTFSAPFLGPSIFPFPPTRTVITDDTGVASLAATANSLQGEYVVTASVGDQSVSFNLANTAHNNPWYVESFAMEDPLKKNTTWWRDTTNQNRLAQHSVDEHTGQVIPVYASDVVSVYVYSALEGSNSVVIVTPSTLSDPNGSYALVGTGGSNAAASAAKAAFTAAIPDFSSKTLRAIIYTDSNESHYWGGPVWAYSASVWASALWFMNQQGSSSVGPALYARRARASGQSLDWGVDSFLGIGSGYEWDATAPQGILTPNHVVPRIVQNNEYPEIAVGSVTVVLRTAPTGDNSAGILVWLPDQKLAIAGDLFPKCFPGVAPFDRAPSGDLSYWISSLSIMAQALQPEILVPLDSLPITGWSGENYPAFENVRWALVTKSNSLSWLQGNTVQLINAGKSLDEIVAQLSVLPDWLSSSPYAQVCGENSVALAAKAMYSYFMGPFGGDPLELTTSVTRYEQARMIVEMAGNMDTLVTKARKAELAAQTLEEAEKALFLASAAYNYDYAYPGVRELYAQVLRKVAYWQTAAQPRNYLLSLALEAEQRQ